MIEAYGGYEAEPRGEECGVAGVFLFDPEARHAGFIAYNGIKELDHRGEDAAGIAATDGLDMYFERGPGKLNKVFNTLSSLLRVTNARAAIGHTRWSTVKSNDPLTELRGAQPHFYIEHGDGVFATSHNGEFTNCAQLAYEFDIDIEDYASDSEFANKFIGLHVEKEKDLVTGVIEATHRLEGAFSLLVMDEQQMIAVRDPQGFRPLMLGMRHDGSGVVVASEDAALEAMGAYKLRDVEPGEMIVINEENKIHSIQYAEPDRNMCMFEFLYFAKARGRIEGINVEAARERMGESLAMRNPVDADMIVGVPESGMPAARGYAKVSGIPLVNALLKVKDVRSFIQSDQVQQESEADEKYWLDVEAVKGKRIVVVDDSGVNFTTARRLLRMYKEAGAKEVHLRLQAPPIKWPCFYGAAFKNRSRLLAAFGPDDQRQLEMWLSNQNDLEFDSIAFNTFADVEHAILDTIEATALKIGSFCSACFTGDYPVEVPLPKKLHIPA